MNSSVKQKLLQEFDETEGDVFATSNAMTFFGFDNVRKLKSFQAIVNKNVVARNQSKNGRS